MADGILNPIEQLEADFDFEVYTKQEVDALLDDKADKSDTYTKTETDALLDGKADADAVYTKTETDTLLSAKADKSTTLAGYGITDAYTKTQTDNLLNGKADADSVYTKTEIDTKIPNTVGSATKPTYVNGGVITECTYELNKTVPANAIFTDTTYSAGNGLNLNGTSFSAKAGTNVTVDGNGINVNGNGVVASADSGLVSGGTAYTELRPTLDGTWVKNAQTTAINLQKLEGGIEYLYAILSKQYDQLKKYINGNYYDYDTDTDAKYVKSVPQGAMPYASLDSVGGKTLVWNQLFEHGNFADASAFTKVACTLSVNDNVGTITVDGNTAVCYIQDLFNFEKSHTYYISADIYNAVTGATVNFALYGVDTVVSSVNSPVTTGTNFVRLERIIKGATSGTENRVRFILSGVSNAGTVQVKNAFTCDLTLMFGAGNEPTTVAEFQQMFPASYYSYNAGTLLSAGVTEVKSVGINVWDEQWEVGGINSTDGQNNGSTDRIRCKNYIPVQSGLDYYFNGLPSTENMLVYCYTFDKKYTGTYWYRNVYQAVQTIPQGTAFVRFNMVSAYGTTYRHDICIHVSNASTNGNYYPYNAHTYPIPAEIQALEGYGWSAGSVFNYIDYEAKKFIQNVARVDLGTLTWTKENNHFYSSVVSTAKIPPTNSTPANVVCAKYVNYKSSSITSESVVGIGLNNSRRFYINDSAYSDAPTLTSALNGVYAFFELTTPIETDISAYLTDDNLIEVESGGTLSFPNSNGTDYQIPVPSSETFMVDLQSALGE